ncbi:STAS domain-containing protein [Planosporangium sp. 12N6]|uniref:STAS domain-containing protein n=1 Tax=Planosporangium spinosum TaxID=3402278 RepID=UPI003CE6EF54
MSAVGSGMGSRRLGVTRSTAGDGVIRLIVSGEVDIGTVDQLRDAITTVLDEPGVGGLLLDFDPLRFLDSSGIAALIAGYHTARQRGAGFGVCNCHGTVRNVLEVTGVYEVLAAGDQA